MLLYQVSRCEVCPKKHVGSKNPWKGIMISSAVAVPDLPDTGGEKGWSKRWTRSTPNRSWKKTYKEWQFKAVLFKCPVTASKRQGFFFSLWSIIYQRMTAQFQRIYSKKRAEYSVSFGKLTHFYGEEDTENHSDQLRYLFCPSPSSLAS